MGFDEPQHTKPSRNTGYCGFPQWSKLSQNILTMVIFLRLGVAGALGTKTGACALQLSTTTTTTYTTTNRRGRRRTPGRPLTVLQSKTRQLGSQLLASTHRGLNCHRCVTRVIDPFRRYEDGAVHAHVFSTCGMARCTRPNHASAARLRWMWLQGGASSRIGPSRSVQSFLLQHRRHHMENDNLELPSALRGAALPDDGVPDVSWRP